MKKKITNCDDITHKYFGSYCSLTFHNAHGEEIEIKGIIHSNDDSQLVLSFGDRNQKYNYTAYNGYQNTVVDSTSDQNTYNGLPYALYIPVSGFRSMISDFVINDTATFRKEVDKFKIISVFGHRVKYSAPYFIFGCGAVRVTESELKNVKKFLSYKMPKGVMNGYMRVMTHVSKEVGVNKMAEIDLQMIQHVLKAKKKK